MSQEQRISDMQAEQKRQLATPASPFGTRVVSRKLKQRIHTESQSGSSDTEDELVLEEGEDSSAVYVAIADKECKPPDELTAAENACSSAPPRQWLKLHEGQVIHVCYNT